MFGHRKACVQVIKGRTQDAAGLREAADRWYREVAPRARGWLGSIGGVTDDGVYVSLTRFTSARAASRNARRPEQARWWDRTRELLDAEVTVIECTDVEMFGRGDPEQAGFVQILQTRIRDREAVRPIFPEEAQETIARLRPDMLGGMFCIAPDGVCTGVAYFTSREAAREGERKEMPPLYKAWRDEQMAHFEQDPVFYDLRDHWVQSP